MIKPVKNTRKMLRFAFYSDFINDYYSWINEFEAHKNEHKIQGDMENVLTGNSKAALIQFVLENLSFIDIWDYKDI